MRLYNVGTISFHHEENDPGLAAFSQAEVGQGVLVAYITRRLDRGYHISGIMRFGPFGRFGGGTKLAEVRVQEGEPLENALRRFKRKVQQEDIIKEVKRHSYYLKPGEKRRVKAALARKRNRKKARKEQD